jgi:hypothetical protein
MSERFEIPLPQQDYNLFAIDDYLRSVGTSEGRKTLIEDAGYSAQAREAYERETGLPRGAVELAMMAEDPRVKQLQEKLNRQLGGLSADDDPKQLRNLYLEVESITNGLQVLYPEAFDFIKQYAGMASRNKADFCGDYAFGNDYRIMKVNAVPPPDVPQWNLLLWYEGAVYAFVAGVVIVWYYALVSIAWLGLPPLVV